MQNLLAHADRSRLHPLHPLVEIATAVFKHIWQRFSGDKRRGEATPNQLWSDDRCPEDLTFHWDIRVR